MAPASPFFYATKQPGGNKTHRPPDTAARLRPTKQPVYFTTEQPGGDTSPFAVLTVILNVPVASSHYILLAIWLVIYVGLLAGTVLYFAKRPVQSPNREAWLALAAAVVFAATFLIGLFGMLPRFVLFLIPFVRFVLVNVLLTVGLRYLLARRQK